MNIIKLLFLSALSLSAADVQRIRIGMPAQTTWAGAPTFNTTALDTGIKAAWIFQAPASESMNQFLVRYGARVGTTPLLHRISLQGVTSAAVPDGNILASAVFNSPADNSLSGLVQAFSLQFDGSGVTQTSYPVTRGTHYSIVVEPCPDSAAGCAGAVTPAGNTLAITTSAQNFDSRMSYPFATTYNGSTWVSQVDLPVFGYRTTASTTRGFPLQSYGNPTVINIGSEMAVHFGIPSNVCSTYRVAGVRAVVQTPAAAKTYAITLYSGTSVVQGPKVIGVNDIRAAGVATVEAFHYFSDATLATLACGTTYIIGFAPQDSGTSSFALQSIDLASAQDRTAFPGGSWFGRSSRTGCTVACNATSTAWAADTDTSRPMVDLILDDMTPPAAGGSGGTKGYVMSGALERPAVRDVLATRRPR